MMLPGLIVGILLALNTLLLIQLRRRHVALARPSGLDLELATVDQLVAELGKREDFACVLITPDCTCQDPWGRGLKIARVRIAVHGFDLADAVEVTGVAYAKLDQARRRERLKKK